ncbi:MAG: ORF6N domain-containing protein [Candidatus Desantisbacteria bacterium]
MSELIPIERIESKILLIRGQKVMLDRDLAELYEVETRVLNQAVSRKIKRFPEDFMFQLTKEELEDWISQIVISNREKMGLRKKPYVFTEQGVAMLSSVLNSERAILVNIQIIRAFTKLRKILASHEEIRRKVEEHDIHLEEHDAQIKVVFDAIKSLMSPLVKDIKEIGFKKD